MHQQPEERRTGADKPPSHSEPQRADPPRSPRDRLTRTAIARPSLLASLADTPPHIRGTVMGLNSTSASVGWIGAAGLGGWMMGSFGFSAFGPLAAGMAAIAAVLALANRR